MIFEDERAGERDRLGFVAPETSSTNSSGIRKIAPRACTTAACATSFAIRMVKKIETFTFQRQSRVYRTAYRAYLQDQDIQDARARWPFVNMWDNHEFSWLGWQSFQKFEGKTRPRQMRKVAALQAFFEYQPARMRRPNPDSLDQFNGPRLVDAPITKFDDHGLGQEPNNLAAIGSLTGYRGLRWGRNVDLMVTDQRSYRSEEPTDMEEAKALSTDDFPEMIPQQAMEILDAAREYNSGNPACNHPFS